MITSVCLNPCIDQSIRIASFTYGGMNRVSASRADAGGKGGVALNHESANFAFFDGHVDNWSLGKITSEGITHYVDQHGVGI